MHIFFSRNIFKWKTKCSSVGPGCRGSFCVNVQRNNTQLKGVGGLLMFLE